MKDIFAKAKAASDAIRLAYDTQRKAYQKQNEEAEFERLKQKLGK